MTLAVRAKVALQHFPLELDLSLPTRGITAIVGPSGAGKTTLLELIAGLRNANDLEVRFNNQQWHANGVSCSLAKRQIGLVLQESYLFPHLTVAENLRYGWQRAQGHFLAWDDVVQRCGLQDLLAQMPQQLSGGQRQRVAFARALLSQPQLLLLDEPFSALDEATRTLFVDYLRQVTEQHQLPAVWVSHQLNDIAEVSDHVVLLNQGRVSSNGALVEQLRQEPLRSMLAMSVVATPLAGLVEGAHQRVRIYARDVSISLQPVADSSVRHQLWTTLKAKYKSSHAAECLVELECEGQTFFALITQSAWQQLGLEIGQRVVAHIKAAALHHPLAERLSEAG